MKKILIVEDDLSIAQLQRDYLELAGFEVDIQGDGVAGLTAIKENQYDLLILDVMLPKISGLDILRSIKDTKDIPVLLVSAKKEEIDKIKGLSLGADDYITKPFNAMELIARVKSQLRRYTRYTTESRTPKNIIEIGNLTINTDTRQVFVDNKDIRLTPKEFDILELLANNKGMVFSIAKIYERVWGEDSYKSDNTIMVHITKIREKIEAYPKKPIYIKTIWGVGYKI